MKILSWNLNHRARQRTIPPSVAEVVAALDVDLALFNEFVDGPTCGSFREQLSSLGYPHQLVSLAPARNNQVFAACRRPLTLGDLAPPATNSSAIVNWLHVRVEVVDLDVLELRVPAYVKSAQRHAYRRALVEILQSTGDRPIVVTGDLKENPFRRDPEARVSPLQAHRRSPSYVHTVSGATSATPADRRAGSTTSCTRQRCG